MPLAPRPRHFAAGSLRLRFLPSLFPLSRDLLPAATHIQEHALRRLLALVDTHWAEAADSIAAIESLSEAGSQLAAAVASKIYYHLEAYPEAVRLALAAGPLFDVDAKTEYVETVVGE